MAKGISRFLIAFPAVKTEIESLSSASADILGVTLENLRMIETMSALRRIAMNTGKDEHEFFLSYVADTEEELAILITANRKEISESLGIDRQ